MTMGCSRTTHVASVEVTHSSISEMDEDARINDMIEPYKEVMDAEMDVVIGVCAKTLEKGRPESTMGNWVADLLVERTSAKYGQTIDFAIQNQGGLRINALGAGEVTIGKLYELMPFDNMIVVLHMRGDSLMRLFDHMARSQGWPISSEVRYTISGDKATDVHIHGESLQSDHIYKFGLPDYIANGGDRCTFLANADKRVDLDYLVRDAIIDHVRILTREGREMVSKEDGRVTNTGNE
ncbi:MAG: hypothetical protein DRI69_05485 [Bacteroidetes bacterium]|nr:MAG: hypothetical protein DRI69_05485 [Bacteroidota bacterium]